MAKHCGIVDAFESGRERMRVPRRLVVAGLPLVALAVAGCAMQRGGPYTVFFETDSAEITPEGLDLIEEAAVEARTFSPRSIAIDGFAGAAGPKDDNERLSAARVDAVVAALVADGVAESLIRRVTAHGEEGAIPGVPGGRRVEIRLLY
jgi:outer membrane protein OmpA-like peptidoglycan-associated protein